MFTTLVSPNDRVVCRMTSTEPCVDEKTVTSNELLMTNSSLPVTLLQFAGRKTTDGNLLNWITASEANSALFVVEHSTDGVNFKPVGEVAAQVPAVVSGLINTYTAHHLAKSIGIASRWWMPMVCLPTVP